MSGINFSSDLIARYRQLFSAAPPAAQAKASAAAPTISAATPTMAVTTAGAAVSGFALPTPFRFDSQYAGQILAAQGGAQASGSEIMLRYRQALLKTLDIGGNSANRDDIAKSLSVLRKSEASEDTEENPDSTDSTDAVDGGSQDTGTDVAVDDTSNDTGTGGDGSQGTGTVDDGSQDTQDTGDATDSTGGKTGVGSDSTGDVTGSGDTSNTGDVTGSTGNTSDSTGDASNTGDATEGAGGATETDTGDGATGTGSIDPGPTTAKATAQEALDALMADIEADADPSKRVARAIFNTIDQSGRGVITSSMLVNAVTSMGGPVDSANALYGELDPNDTGRVTEQQFMQNFTLNQVTVYSMDQITVQPAFFAVNALAQSVPVASLMMSQPAVPAPAAAPPSPFEVIDANRDGIATKAEVADVVTSAGGTMASANALYAKLDTQGAGAVTAQEFYNNAPIPAFSFYDPFNGVYIDTGPATPAQDGISAVYQAVASENDPVKQFTRGLYERLDANGDNNLTKTEVEQGVVAAGGSRASADALYAQLNTRGASGVTERQFAATVPPPAMTVDKAAALTAAMRANSPALERQVASNTAARTSGGVDTRIMNALLQAQSIMNG
jgi:Ca2+-binding EF-hand superfamily protein